jgi:hypothetical protein
MDKKNRLHQERLDDVWDAASHGDHVRLSILLHTPSSIASNTYKTVALMAAVRNHKEATVQWLLNARADPNQEYAGCSVLDDAALLCTSKTILNLLVHNTKCPAVITPKTLRLAISREQYRTPQNNQFEWFMSNGGKECVQGTWHITELLQQCQDAGQPLAGQALALQDMVRSPMGGLRILGQGISKATGNIHRQGGMDQGGCTSRHGICLG